MSGHFLYEWVDPGLKVETSRWRNEDDKGDIMWSR